MSRAKNNYSKWINNLFIDENQSVDNLTEIDISQILLDYRTIFILFDKYNIPVKRIYQKGDPETKIKANQFFLMERESLEKVVGSLIRNLERERRFQEPIIVSNDGSFYLLKSGATTLLVAFYLLRSTMESNKVRVVINNP